MHLVPDTRIIHGDMRAILPALAADSFEVVITDPPYDLPGGFMNKSWDKTGIAFNSQTWREVMRVLKPGGYVLAFGGTRTFHRIACALEDAGFEYRDTLCWLYGSGFPKSLSIDKSIDKAVGVERKVIGRANGVGSTNTKSLGEYATEYNATLPTSDLAKEWSGWGTALKPAWEPILMARKPFSGTVALNIQKHGAGALNIDACRIGYEEGGSLATNPSRRTHINGGNGGNIISHENERRVVIPNKSGRWPANVVLSHSEACVKTGRTQVKARVINRFDDGAKPFGEGAGHPYTSESLGNENGNETIDTYDCELDCAVRLLDEQTGVLTSGEPMGVRHTDSVNAYGLDPGRIGTPVTGFGDSGGASRFFYTSKSSVYEREVGLEAMPKQSRGAADGAAVSNTNKGPTNAIRPDDGTVSANNHPTVKPLDLMRWLVKLVTKPGGTVLDCFMGSGSTGCAAVIEGMNFVGIEAEVDYVAIAEKRIAYWKNHPAPYVIAPVLERQLKPGQIVSIKPVRAKPADPKQAGLFE